MTKKEFEEMANIKHNYKYDYSLVPDKISTVDTIHVICNEKYPWGEPHGIFNVNVGKHLHRGDGRTKCSGKYKRTKEDFVKEATYIHKGLYTYGDFIWNGVKSIGIIHCTKHNLDFPMSPQHHLDGQGCPKCRYEKASKSKMKTQEEFLKEAHSIFGDRYDYTDSVYKGDKENLTVICREHGKFDVTPNNHLNKYHPEGCPICGKLSSIKSRTYTNEKFIKLANNKHNYEYDYTKTDVNNKDELGRVCIICNNHGEFWQKPSNHLFGQGCKKCHSFRSKGERDVENFVKSLGFLVETTNRKILDGEELDIFIPSKRIAIEYNGLRWHSTKFKDKNYHLDKSLKCERQGINLIHIFENEWNYKKDIVKSYIKSIIGISDTVTDAKECIIKEIDTPTARQFINENNIEEYRSSSVRIGLLLNNEIASIITFKRSKICNGYELLQRTNKRNTSVENDLETILNYFVDKYKPSKISVKVDRRYNNGVLYENVGFVKCGETKPKHYCFTNKAYKVDGTETIYDCGKIIYEKHYKLIWHEGEHLKNLKY